MLAGHKQSILKRWQCWLPGQRLDQLARVPSDARRLLNGRSIVNADGCHVKKMALKNDANYVSLLDYCQFSL